MKENYLSKLGLEFKADENLGLFCSSFGIVDLEVGADLYGANKKNLSEVLNLWEFFSLEIKTEDDLKKVMETIQETEISRKVKAYQIKGTLDVGTVYVYYHKQAEQYILIPENNIKKSIDKHYAIKLDGSKE